MSTLWNVNWSIDNNNIATIDSNGLITALNIGDTIININVNGLIKQCNLTVINNSTYIYFNGNEYTDITGNWRISQDIGYISTGTKNSDSINYQCRGSIPSWAEITYTTTKMIDITNYKYLKALITTSGNQFENVANASGIGFMLGIGTNKNLMLRVPSTNTNNFSTLANLLTPETNYTMSVNITDFNGDYYIGAGLYSDGYPNYQTLNANIYKIWFE